MRPAAGRGRVGAAASMPRKCLPALVNTLALGHQHRREEDQQQDLGELGGLNARSPGKRIQILAPFVSEKRAGSSAGNRQQHKAGQPAGVAVAGQDAVVFEEDDHQREADDPDEGPQHLLVWRWDPR